MQPRNRGRRRRLDRVGDGDQPGELAVDGDEDGGGALAAQPLRLPFEGIGGDRQVMQESGVADVNTLALDHAQRPLAGRRIEAHHPRRGDAARLRGRNDRLRQRMLAGLLDAGREFQHRRLVLAVRRHDRGDRRLALGQRAGLVDHQRIDPLHSLQRRGVLDEHAGAGAASDADHDRHRRGEAQRAGAGNDQHADGGDQREGEARLRSPRRPGGESQQRREDHQRHEPAGDLVGEALDRRAAALGVGDHLHDAGSSVSRPTFSAVITSAPERLMVPPISVSPSLLPTGMDSPVTIDSSSDERPSTTDAVHRHLLAGAHAQPVADDDGVERDLLFRCRLPLTRRAVLGARSSSARMAPEVCSRARSSSTWPSSTSTVMTAAASK